MWQLTNLRSLNFQPYCVFEPLRKLPRHQKGGDLSLPTEQQGGAPACRWVNGLEAEPGLRLKTWEWMADSHRPSWQCTWWMVVNLRPQVSPELRTTQSYQWTKAVGALLEGRRSRAGCLKVQLFLLGLLQPGQSHGEGPSPGRANVGWV